MIDPAEVQAHLRSVLIANADVAALIGSRIYDGAPADAESPYITFGPSATVNADAECIISDTETVQLDIWWDDQGRLHRCKRLCALVRRAVTGLSADLPGFAVVDTVISLDRVMIDADGRTAHGVLQIDVMAEAS